MCLPLCPNHHRNGPESYHYSPKNFTKKWGTQKELLTEILTQVKVLDDVEQKRMCQKSFQLKISYAKFGGKTLKTKVPNEPRGFV